VIWPKELVVVVLLLLLLLVLLLLLLLVLLLSSHGKCTVSASHYTTNLQLKIQAALNSLQ
jgi:hypothetical protein